MAQKQKRKIKSVFQLSFVYLIITKILGNHPRIEQLDAFS